MGAIHRGDGCSLGAAATEDAAALPETIMSSIGRPHPQTDNRASRRQQPQRRKCDRCDRRLSSIGICFPCEEADREAGGWTGSLGYGAQRINHLPQA